MADEEKVEHMEVTPDKLRELLALRTRASSGHWKLGNGLFGVGNISITTWWRERPDSKLGYIASVPTEHTMYAKNMFDENTRHTLPISMAQDDATLIIAAVNWLEPMAKALLENAAITDTMWVIEYHADKYGPVRWWAAGEPPVIDVNDATQFFRQQDAQSMLRVDKTAGGRVVEYKRPNPMENGDE